MDKSIFSASTFSAPVLKSQTAEDLFLDLDAMMDAVERAGRVPEAQTCFVVSAEAHAALLSQKNVAGNICLTNAHESLCGVDVYIDNDLCMAAGYHYLLANKERYLRFRKGFFGGD